MSDTTRLSRSRTGECPFGQREGHQTSGHFSGLVGVRARLPGGNGEMKKGNVTVDGRERN